MNATGEVGASAAPRRGRLRAWLLAWIGTFGLFVCTAHGNLESLDSTATMHAARALWLRGDSGLLRAEQGGQWLGEMALAAEVERQRAAGVAWYGKQGAGGRTYVWFPVGHLWLMVPLVALGEALHRTFPAVEQRFRDRVAGATPEASLPTVMSYRDGHFVFDHAMVALVLPAAFAATSLLLLFLLARALGANGRDALWTAAAIGLASQFFPLGSETLSDGPGLCFLLAVLLAVVRATNGVASPRTLVLGGAAAGAAVLARYAHIPLIPVFGLAIAVAAWRQRRPALLVWFALGGLPFLLLFAGVNHARFGDWTDTGYPRAGSWFNYPVVFGVTKLLVAAGKGVLWFSPLLWLALPAAVRGARRLVLGWLALVLFAVPMLLFGSTLGWQSGQCWGARYVTPGVVCLLVLVLPQTRPWVVRPRLFATLFAVGCLVNLTGVAAPTRGHNQLAGQAVRAMYDHELAAGRITADDRASVDPPDHFFFLPRFSPLHANWNYLWRSATGGFEDEHGQPRHGSAHTIEPLFGIAAVPGAIPPQDLAPMYWEDRGGRHLWWVFWGELLGVAPWLLLAPVLVLAGAAAWTGWRQLARAAAGVTG
jgi:hypothetical protein